MSFCKCSPSTDFCTDIVVGDTVHWSFTFTDNCDDPLDITGWEIWVILKKSVTDTDSAAVLKIKREIPASADSAAGKTTVTLRSNESSTLVPGKYHYEFKRVIPATNPPDVWTFAMSTKTSPLSVLHGTYIKNL